MNVFMLKVLRRLLSADRQTRNPGLDRYHPELRGNERRTAGELIS